MPPQKQTRPRVIRHAPDYRHEPAQAQYTHDRKWMPELVLVAKNTYVWLEQLSRQYTRAPSSCSGDVPDEELDKLSARGLTGLWLIGIWERSTASRRLKQRMGQPDAAASAYSIYDYQVAADLGGEAAVTDLKTRAIQRGIRLSADMVPNHMGIDLRWVIEHPEWFISVDRPPFAVYSFTHENLSEDPRAEIYLEDHYYDQTQTSVVFKRVDTATGNTRYIYHGNDGTSFVWNDTAQLDFSRLDVRQAVTQTILAVARKFPIIRFDAAMTLAREHIHRLWFPETDRQGRHSVTLRAWHDPARVRCGSSERVLAGGGGSCGGGCARYAARRGLLDDGRLLRAHTGHASRRQLGLHAHAAGRGEPGSTASDQEHARVDPQILKRHVNFMSNPDEETAIDQFGTDDKYFGVCTVLATLPGLPMFAHGQMDGTARALRHGVSPAEDGREVRNPSRRDVCMSGASSRCAQSPPLRRRAGLRLFDFAGRGGKVDEMPGILQSPRQRTCLGAVSQQARLSPGLGAHRRPHPRTELGQAPATWTGGCAEFAVDRIRDFQGSRYRPGVHPRLRRALG